MHDLIKILFIGETWSKTNLYFVEQNTKGEVVCRNKIQAPSHTCQKHPLSDTLIGIENCCGVAGLDEVKKLIDGLDWRKIVGAYIVTQKITDAKQILKEISKNKLWDEDLYGVDPDYFQTMVPIRSNNLRTIENYLLDLKLDRSIKGRIKLLVKKIFVRINFSEKLYERFVITISPKIKG